jgi:arylsulfate sulfotransferase
MDKISMKKLIIILTVATLAGCNESNDAPVTGCGDSSDNAISDINYQLNPSGNSPLTANIQFSTKNQSTSKITINGNDPITIESSTCESLHSFDLIGLYANIDNDISISVNDGEITESVIIQTAPLPDYMPQIHVDVISDEKNHLTLINYRPSGAPFMVDRNGMVRWYLDVPEGKYGLIKLKNGNFAYGLPKQDKIVEYSWMGELKNTWNLGSNYTGVHHDLVEKPNGNFLVTVDKVGIATVEDHVIELDRESSEVVKVWDMLPLLPTTRGNLRPDVTDWFHNNAIAYDETNDALLLSGQRQGLVKVTNDNALVWVLSQTDGYKGNNVPKNGTPDYEGWDGYEDYLLTSDVPDFEFIWGQHAPLIRENGNIMLFDNGYNRYYEGVGNKTFSRAVEFKITENTDSVGGSLELIWEYGTSRGADFQSPIISDVDDLGESILITSGSLAFEGGWDITQLQKAKIVEVDYNTKAIKSEITITSDVDASGSVYRSERLSFSDLGLTLP